MQLFQRGNQPTYFHNQHHLVSTIRMAYITIIISQRHLSFSPPYIQFSDNKLHHCRSNTVEQEPYCCLNVHTHTYTPAILHYTHRALSNQLIKLNYKANHFHLKRHLLTWTSAVCYTHTHTHTRGINYNGIHNETSHVKV